jgi:hypothetical protein
MGRKTTVYASHWDTAICDSYRTVLKKSFQGFRATIFSNGGSPKPKGTFNVLSFHPTNFLDDLQLAVAPLSALIPRTAACTMMLKDFHEMRNVEQAALTCALFPK